jgi:hypothetical protein
MDPGSACCVVAAVAAVAVIAWRTNRVAEAACAAMARMSSDMAALSQSRPWSVIERREDGTLSTLDREQRGEFPKDKTTTVHQQFSKPVPLEAPPDGLVDPLARAEDFRTLTERQ